ncbi:MAG: DUF1697 domain-containing protein [Ignavibacteriales bacterium]|nr:MAG: DUF1697 domain-containing protein [Ignavibacteriales bacterium]
MPAYISLIRGINVSGQKKIKMVDLSKAYEELKFKNVKTYIQSGNVLFDNKSNETSSLSKKIEKKILEKFGFDVSVVVLNRDELNSVIKNNPFTRRKNSEGSRMYVAFMTAVPEKSLIEKLNPADFKPEEFVIEERTIYMYLPSGYGTSKINNNFFESKLKVKATTRNWNTVNILSELAAEIKN